MPTGNLSAKAKKIFLKAEASAKKTCPKGDRFDECVARKGWAAVKRGWKKVGDKWVPKNTAEFSLYINKASFDKTTQEMRWFAVASDIEPDSYNDSMSLELYADFERRIESEELPPERHRSDYWSGGMPYLSLSHYLDMNGEAVPGPTDSVYVDGKCLKANGRFNNTVLGKACFDAICDDLYGEEKSDHENKVRISIAFIDWGHTHKSDGHEFIRESLDEMCPDCFKELIIGEGDGKTFQKGHLIHLALTREPVNTRTSMEVRSMITQKEDAASIAGDEEATRIDELKAEDEVKADLIIKSEQEDGTNNLIGESTPVTKVEKKKHVRHEEDEEDDEDKKKKKDEKKSDVVEKAIKEPVPHVLYSEIETFLSAYDVVAKSNFSYNDKLEAVQDAYATFGEAIKSSFAPTSEEKGQADLSEIKSMLTQLLNRQDVTEQKLAVLEQQGLSSDPQKSVPPIVRRSLQLNSVSALEPAQRAAPGSIRALANKSAGLQ